MKKDIIVIAFPRVHQSEWYFESQIAPFLDNKKRSRGKVETDNCIFYLKNFNHNGLRGMNADKIIVSDYATIKFYDEILMPLVQNDHNRITVI